MATRSLIGYLEPDGTYTAIYCHNDGYLSYNGFILLNHYNDIEKIKNLLSGGDVSSLKEEIEETKYFKDDSSPCNYKFHEIEEIFKDYWIEYIYVFSSKDGWSFSKDFKEYKKLTLEEIEKD